MLGPRLLIACVRPDRFPRVGAQRDESYSEFLKLHVDESVTEQVKERFLITIYRNAGDSDNANVSSVTSYL